MGILKEISDKKLIIESLKEVATRNTNKLIISTTPGFSRKELLPDMHQWFRIVILLSGEYRFGYYENELKENVLPYDSLLMTLPDGGLLIDKSTEPFRCLQIIFRDTLIRYLFVENEITYWYNSSNPLRLWGNHILKSIYSMPLLSEFDALRKELVEILIKISLTEIEEDNSMKKGKAFNTYHSALEFMRENLHRKLDRSTIANVCGVTPSHLSKLCRQFGQEDFNQSLKKLRIERSMLMLNKSALTINEIAFLCGFKTAAHFIRIFRKLNGVSPGRFRNLKGKV
jgi:AraC-like DNA-binding protein